ncbi:ABC transporter permease subunit [Pseudohongiella sp.]|uniref:ABC transmembrane type-1 domain-containing protein n=1 Tax=marine sediment metagenome TaxID=412755 RepID=A0A0F9WGC8_9ZZZZ|nr:ABC transporter permease subunit [Pseudohongiella sp.]HDZ09256.1 ABC transporter permease subunit [Pseudohongiella sp.]HEA62120.1 ABC transporter permease subunit [Pseudohongiella sp.]
MTDTTPDLPAPGKSSKSLLPDHKRRQALRKKRMRRDKMSRWGITAAGYGVVLALATIFIYLFYEVAPILRGATVTPQDSYTLPDPDAQTYRLLLDRYEELGIQYTNRGQAVFFDANTGVELRRFTMPVTGSADVTSFGAAEAISNTSAFGFSNGEAVVTRHAYQITFPDNVRQILPRMEYPLGEEPLVIDEQGSALRVIAVENMQRGAGMAVAAVTEDGRLLLANMTTRTNLLTGATQVSRTVNTLPAIPGRAQKLLIDKSLSNLFVLDDSGMVHYYDISTPAQARLVQSVDVGGGSRVTAAEFLVGAVSIVFGTEQGELSQWFLVRDEQNQYSLEEVRQFNSHGAAITSIAPEYTRKGFVAVDAAGQLGVHYATSARTLFLDTVSDDPLQQVAISQINTGLLWLDAQGDVVSADMWNEHPQLSWDALWNKVWYEGRADPEYIWQSSSGSDEFESKFSLMPLTIGTLKAAFYAMLFAMPLAIAGAIYTAYFMTPKLRGVVKPSIEIMEALPTVILGFLAGLWLAPFVESHLPAIFSFFILMPVMMLLFAYLWGQLPAQFRNRVPDGWEAALMVPLILVFGTVCIQLSPWVEIWFFDGSMRQWFTDIGITYDQRNALIVGIAMGFAVIPTIFSIAEDAVFTVPRHLTQGSLALGATRWQTVMGVVLPTASPGIFSAVMMGFGRAVGETMIVLMATGNSPVVNFNIFEGMRTLSANIAVELPETAVGSSHFRVLFLAALVLLALTFVVNTIAEIIRQRLRLRYSNL